MMRFVLRDDDLNYFSLVSDIERWYAEYFSQGIPVLFSVVPFVTPRKASIYPKGMATPAPGRYAFSGNETLVRYVRDNEYIEVAQHGYEHEPQGSGFEYRRGQDMKEKTLEGKMELERALGKPISIFVPPHDAIDNKGILAVEQARMDIIRGTGSKNVRLTPSSIRVWIKMLTHRLRFPDKETMPAYPYVVDFGGHKEAYAVRLNDQNIDFLLNALRWTARKEGDFIVTNHIHTTNEKRMRNLATLIEEARRLGFSFARASELFDDGR